MVPEQGRGGEIVTSHTCTRCGQPYERDPEVQAKWSRTRPETEGLCLECISRTGAEKIAEEEAL